MNKTMEAERLKLCLRMMKLIWAPPKGRPLQWSCPHHQSKPKSARTCGKHQSRKPNVHQSPSSGSVLDRSPYPRKEDLVASSETPRTPGQSCPVSELPLLMLCNTCSCPDSLGKCCTVGEALHWPNPWIFPWIKDIQPIPKLYLSCHLARTEHHQTQRLHHLKYPENSSNTDSHISPRDSARVFFPLVSAGQTPCHLSTLRFYITSSKETSSDLHICDWAPSCQCSLPRSVSLPLSHNMYHSLSSLCWYIYLPVSNGCI